MSFEVGKHNMKIKLIKTGSYKVFRYAASAGNRDADVGSFVQYHYRGNGGKAVVLRNLIMCCGACPSAAVGGVCFNDSAVYLLNKVFYKIGFKVMGIAGFSGMQLDGYISACRKPQRFIGSHEAGRANVAGEKNLWAA
jgi:hypothetical protein